MRSSILITVLLLSTICAPAQEADTSFSVFHHNYLVERQSDLMTFAEELVAYAEAQNSSKTLREKVLQYQENIAAINVWESTDVVKTMHHLNTLHNRGDYLRSEVVDEAERSQWLRDAASGMKTALPYLLAVLAFPLVYYFLFKRK